MYSPKPQEMVQKQYERMKSEVLRRALKVQSEILQASGGFLRQRGFIEILPVIMSPVTDPLRHATGKAEVEHYEHRYQLTRSMIFHKQIALLALDRIFAFSPNIRLEPIELADTGRHLVEFTQLDLEMKGATREEAMDLGEDLVIHVMEQIGERCPEEMRFFKRDLVIPRRPFERITYREARDRYAGNFEAVISQQHDEPVWIIDIALEAREFYDREDPDRPGTLLDMDLLYPEGFGEALSGGEREHTFERVRQRIEKTGLEPEEFELYLAFTKRGLPASAGFGIGIERLTRFVCGLRTIEEVALFPKVPGTLSL
ncbi:MAG: asparagine synthetase A [Anaerolineae bacterium]